MGADNATWGLVGASSAVGDLVAIAVTMVLIGRTRIRRLTRVGALLMLLSGPLLAGASAFFALAAGLVIWGFGATLLATAVNTQGVTAETTYGRKMVPFFHACYSCSVLVGGLYGSASAALGMTPGVQLAISTATFGLLLLVTANWLPDDAPQADASHTPLRERLRNRWGPQLRLLALLAFVASFIEGTVGQWSAIYATDSAGANAAVAAGIYTAFTVAILVVRLVGDLVMRRVAVRTFLQWSLLIAGLGIATVILWPSTATVVVGFVVAGVGIGCVMPAVIRLAGKQPDVSAGEGVSTVTLGQWPGFLLASPVIGVVAGATDLRTALTLLIVCGVGGALLARKVEQVELSQKPSST